MPKVGKKGYICALDIGSDKVVCLIAQSVPVDGQIDVLGVGYQQAQGIKKGMITDVESATQCIQSAVLKAEKEAQLHVSSVIVNVSSSKLVSKIIQSKIEIEDDHLVTSSDIKRLVDQTLKQVDLADQEVILQMPLYYILDDQELEDPRGLSGKILGVKLHLLCLPVSHMKNLETVLNKCRLGIDYKVATPYASALACLTEEEKKIGAVLIDIGADTTSIALYLNNILNAIATLPLGGNLITKDIAQGLMTSFSEAERLKTLEGAAFSSPKDENETLNIRVVGESQDNAVYSSTKAYLNDIIESRVEEMLETIQMYLSSVSQYGHIATQHVVLTGGASRLEGLREKTASALQAHVQLSGPVHVRGLPADWNKPAFATSVGLLRYALNKQSKKSIYKKSEIKVPRGIFGRIAQWLIQNF
jgi:cell division protein FtsA